MIKAVIYIRNADLDGMADWLDFSDHFECMSMDTFVKLFNKNKQKYIQRAKNWSLFHKCELTVTEISAEEVCSDNVMKFSLIVENIDIIKTAVALGVPKPLAVIAAHIGERGIGSSVNTVLQLNKGLISKEAIRQLNLRNMTAEAVWCEVAVVNDNMYQNT